MSTFTFSEGFHELVALRPAILRFVRVPQDDLVDVGLVELFGLNLVFLRCSCDAPRRPNQKHDIEFQYSDVLDQAAIGMFSSPSKLKPCGTAHPYPANLLLLVLFVLGLGSADAYAVLL
jgi:hypothetical protein